MTALAAPTDVRSFLSLAANQDDALLTSLCDAASAFVLSYLNIPGFAIATYSETVDGTGTRTLVTRNRPITDVASVTVNGRVLPRSTGYGVNGYTFDRFGIYLRGYVFDRDILNVDITYSAGYASVPYDIKQAVVEIVAEKYQRRLRMGVASKSIGQESISYNQNDLTPHAKLVLSQYRVSMIP